MPKSKKDSREEKSLDLQKISAIIRKNFIVMTRDKIRLVPLLIFPIVMILVLGFTSGNTPKHISTAIVAFDDSQISQELQQDIANSNTFAIRHVVSTESEGKKLLDSGEVRVLIIIPPHLQDDIDNGVQSGITVMVDESDSSVAMTSKQTLNMIIGALATKISLQKLNEYQQSVDSASQSLAESPILLPSQYASIAGRSAAAETYLTASQRMIDADTQAMSNALPLPSSVVLPVNATTYYRNESVVQDQSNILIIAPATSLAQIGLLQTSSAYISAANQNTHAVTIIARNADEKEKAIQQEYQIKVMKSIGTIHVFTKARADTIQRPIIYEEKPAYGTGRHPIDFLIPSLIALTIFQGAVMGMGRSVAGEKRDGSLTRVFLTPTSNLTIVSGTLTFYVLFEMCRAAFLIIISMLLFNIKIQGSLLLVALILLIYITISASIGMIISSIVKTEQQFMAMAMLISLPTMFLAGAFFPVQAMPKFMQVIASFLPVTYAGDALRGVIVKGLPIWMIAYPLLILFGFLILTVAGIMIFFKRDIE